MTDQYVVAPADGRVLSTGIAPVPADLDLPEGEWRRIAIFMNVFDVHVNRAPVAGQVTATSYHPGQFFNASLDKAADENERQNIVMETVSGQQIGMVQIAGWWRVVSFWRPGLVTVSRLASNSGSFGSAAAWICGFRRLPLCW